MAAVLLIALAFIGGPDMLNTTPPTAQVKITSAETAGERDPRVRDDADAQRWAAHRAAPHRHWLPALLPLSSQSHVPAMVRVAAMPAVPKPTPATGAGDRRWRHFGACSPESLQIFRC
jgi:hypothetical protein